MSAIKTLFTRIIYVLSFISYLRKQWSGVPDLVNNKSVHRYYLHIDSESTNEAFFGIKMN